MNRYKLPILLLGLLLPCALLGQALSRVMVVDFERAVVECSEGKKASAQFNVKFEERKKDIEKRQKDLDDKQNKLRTQERALNEQVKADLQKDIERLQTDLTRINEDAQKELQTLREELLRPIADKANQILYAYAAEQGYTLVIDASNPQNNVIWVNPKNDITTELIRRIDAELAKEAPKKPGGGN